MKLSRLLAFLLPAIAGAASTTVQFVPNSPYGMNEQRAIPLPGGNVLIAGSQGFASCSIFLQNCDQIQQSPHIIVLDSTGLQTKAFADPLALGSGNGIVLDAAVDPSGNIWIAGQTDSDDFPLVHALFTYKRPYHVAGFVAKLDSNLNILFSTFLAGQPPPGQPYFPSAATNIAIDAAGNAYIAGNTGEPGFPTTGPVFGTGTAGVGPSSEYPLVYTFVAKISPDGSQLIYSHLLGGDQLSCVSPMGCMVSGGLGAANTTANALAIDTEGNATIAGFTTASNFPVTPNAYQSICKCVDMAQNGFVTRISADGSKLLWSTYFANSVTNATIFDEVQSIALDAFGNVYLAGETSSGMATSPGALQPSVTGGGGFAAKLSSDGAKLLYATNLGGTGVGNANAATLRGLTLDPSGNAWIAGSTNAPDFPGLSNTPATGIDFALELNGDGSALEQIIGVVPGTVTQPPSFDSTGNLLLFSSKGNLLRLDTSNVLSAPAVLALTNAAIGTAEAGIAPGEIVTLYGVGLGPSPGIVGTPNDKGLYPIILDGVKVQFENAGPSPVDGPLLYVGPNQINFQVPFAFSGQSSIVITTPTMTLAPIWITQITSVGVFHEPGSNYAAALNQDQSINSASNPAKPGSIISLFATGPCGGNDFN